MVTTSVDEIKNPATCKNTMNPAQTAAANTVFECKIVNIFLPIRFNLLLTKKTSTHTLSFCQKTTELLGVESHHVRRLAERYAVGRALGG